MTDMLALLNGTALGPFAAVCLGLIWGSFFNVVILRLPEDESIVKRGSHCPKCQAPIRWYHNIPVFSYLALRGKCAGCQTRISIQYPIVEFVTGGLYLWLSLRFGWTIQFLVYGIFISMLLIISVIDLYHQIIPDELSLSGIVLGLIAAFILPEGDWWSSLLGVGLGGGVFLAIAWAYEKYSGREGLGGGDVKLLGMIGAWLGFRSILIVIVVSSGLGSVVGIAFMAFQGKNMRTAIPFGPFLALAALVYVFWGPVLQEFLFPAPFPR